MQEKLKSPLFIAFAAALLCIAGEATHLVNHMYWNVFYKFAPAVDVAGASIVSLDDGKPVSATSVAASTAEQAKLIDRLIAARPKAVFLDYPQVFGADQVGDAALRSAIVRAGDKVVMVNRAETKVVSTFTISELPKAEFPVPVGIRTAASAWNVNFLGSVLTSPQTVTDPLTGSAISTVAAYRASRGGTHDILPELRVRPNRIAVASARDILTGSGQAGALASQTVFVTYTNPNLDSALRYSGYSAKVPGAVADIAGQKGRISTLPFNLGDWPLLAFCLLAIMFGRNVSLRPAKWAIYGTVPVAMLVSPVLLRDLGVTIDFGAALFALMVYAPYRSIQKWRSRVELTSAVSGLPNLESFSRADVSKTDDVITVVVSQYEHILANLPREMHGECANQIARRLSVGAGDRTIYDLDGGHFAWLDNSRTLDEIIGNFEGLRALFSAPLVIGGQKIDTTIHFGLDRNSDTRTSSRIQSALACASEALSKSKLYEEFGQQRMEHSPWELSMHARIDEGLQNGDIWLALQPQLDFRTGQICGAEALIRWNDPERGAVPPDVFILQAERANRIDTITYWVLTKAIGMSHSLNRAGARLQISVNLSARMVDHPALVGNISDIVRDHPIDCSLITLEVTETFSMANREVARDNLAALRLMGFRLSIDDFGTGQASLAYLAEIPSDEVKLDRRFVQAIVTDARERTIVDSVIRLAHALGQEVVAEGIEDAATLEVLRGLNCDLAQGYYIGKPIPFVEFSRMLFESRSRTISG